MRRVTGLICFCLGWTGVIGAADYQFGPAGWALEARLPAPPETDTVLTPSPQGDIRATPSASSSFVSPIRWPCCRARRPACTRTP